MPLYYHLLTPEDIERLGVVLEILRGKRRDVLADWYDLYCVHFGDDRTFGEAEFLQLFGDEFDAIIKTMLERDMQALARAERKVGERLFARNVPFSEVIASMHLFEESAAKYYRKRITVLARGIDIPILFDKLSHVRMILLAESFYGRFRAEQVVRAQELERELSDLGTERRTVFHGIVGGSRPMQELYGRIQAAAAGGASVLISGESGTGKELVARALHECSPRRKAAFVPVNCAALPRELIESELFGHRRGAFSGATDEYTGLVRTAHGGTLFLDEVTEMPADTQAKLLRVLQDGQVRPVGATREITVDVRFVASTNRDPDEAVERGTLRSDLYYRLKVHHLRLPPLRERHDDIELLVGHFVDLFNARDARRVAGVDEVALRILEHHDWPGNVRELMNAIEVAFAYARGDRILASDLPSELGGNLHARSSPAATDGAAIPTFEDSERQLLERALAATNGNKLQSARILGISRKQLYAKIKKYGIAAAPEA
jgi:DNA-binding NtrC family response regulator